MTIREEAGRDSEVEDREELVVVDMVPMMFPERKEPVGQQTDTQE